MCVILLMLPFVGRAQQQKVSVRVNKAGVYTGGENPINKTDIMNNVSSNYWQMYNNADMRVVSGISRIFL